jgi:YYY domain-containing protein
MEFGLVFQWWGTIFLMGLVFLPLTFFTFRKFYDKGYVLSRAIGLVVVSYSLWLLTSLRIISYVQTNMWIYISVFALLNAGLVYWKWDYFKGINYKKLIKPVVICEAIFLVGLIYWSWVRGHQPSIEGIEKFMNQGFIMSILRADYMPAPDMWFAGQGINYYYFGHFLTATLIKTAGIAPEIGYNLMVATLFGLMVAFPYCITSNLLHRHVGDENGKARRIVVIGGLISSAVMAFGANLHPFFEGVVANLMNGNRPFEYYWYPNATRYIGHEGSFLPNISSADGCIHEFPNYAAIIADLHAHFTGLAMAFMFSAFVIAMMFRMLGNLDEYEWYKPRCEMWLYGIFLACSYMANTWDFPIYLMLFGLAIWMVNIKKFGCNWVAFIRAVIVGVAMGVFSLILAIPFHINFDSFAEGISSGLLTGNISGPDRFFILWGHYLFMTGAFIWVIFKSWKEEACYSVKETLQKLKEQSSGLKFGGKVKGVLEHISVADAVALVMLVCAVILIYLPEVVYVKDIYTGHPRGNTMFKLTYQAFIIFTFALGYAFFRIFEGTWAKRRKIWISVCMVFVVALPLLYTLPRPFGGHAIHTYYAEMREYKGLDGYDFFLKNNNYVLLSDESRVHVDMRGDLEVVRWLNENTTGHPTIVEAYGGAFTIFGRISMATGLPTIVGWEKHQWLWRGDYGTVIARQVEVREIYESDNINSVKNLLREYGVRFIVIGDIERAQFPNMDEARLRSLGRVVVNAGNTQLIEVRI